MCDMIFGVYIAVHHGLGGGKIMLRNQLHSWDHFLCIVEICYESWERYFVVDWFVQSQYKTIHYFVKCS